MAACELPLSEADPMYVELVSVSVALIQSNWRAKRRRNRRPRFSAPPRPSPACAVYTSSWSEVDVSMVFSPLARIQAVVRARMQREKLKRDEASIMRQAAVLSSLPESKPSPLASVPGKGVIFGRAEQADYIAELQSRQAFLRRQIDRLKLEKLYQMVEEQRRSAARLKEMHRQLRDLSQEISLVKGMGAAGFAISLLEQKEPVDHDVALKWKATASKAIEAGHLKAPTALATQLCIARFQYLRNSSCSVCLRLTPQQKQNEPAAHLRPDLGEESQAASPRIQVLLSLQTSGGAGIYVKAALAVKGPGGASNGCEKSVDVSASLSIAPPAEVMLRQQRRLKHAKREFAAIFRDPRMQFSAISSVLLIVQGDREVVGEQQTFSRLLQRVRDVSADMEELRMHARIAKRNHGRIEKQLVVLHRRLTQLSHVEALQALGARQRRVRSEIASLKKQRVELVTFSALMVLMVQILQVSQGLCRTVGAEDRRKIAFLVAASQEERALVRKHLMRQLMRKHVSHMKQQYAHVLEAVQIQQAERARQVMPLLAASSQTIFR
ncbi:MAG: hypothetical protein SGPRY_005619 [Prymnesium sp.]